MAIDMTYSSVALRREQGPGPSGLPRVHLRPPPGPRIAVMATSPAPEIRNLQHTTVAALNLNEAEAEAFRQKLARIAVDVLNDPPPSDDAFHR